MHFIEFYNSFYQGERVYSANPEQQFDIFDYRELGITILAFNSCFHNDHLNRAGAINPICIANANLRVRELQKQGRLLLATWHHNTKGGPYDQDYMDDTFIQTLIAHEVKFGFHGHQHRNEVVREENNIVDAKSMLAISAGTLCGGPEALPPGHNRQYNVLHFNRIDDDNISLRLFSRLKTPESSFENPVWGEGSVDGAGTMEFSTRITHIYRTGAEIRAAEKLVGNGDFDSAEDILKKLDFEDVFTRKLLLECYTQKSDFQAILQAFQAPVSNDEAVALINACIEVRDAELGRKIVEIPFVKNSIDPSVMHLRGQLDARLK
ncbi:MAG: hypothetical protein P1V20_22560 [Verrucomicrobiales bacterium]|nr:hypothetical protein [Verrucomicrobiales bacterium]